MLAELGIRSVGNSLGIDRPKNFLMSLIGYVILAALAGFISLYIFKHQIIANDNLRILNLIVTPFIAGYLMHLKGKYLISKNKPTIRLDSFWYGYAFALVFGAVRFFGVN
jgi:hypothetical protein